MRGYQPTQRGFLAAIAEGPHRDAFFMKSLDFSNKYGSPARQVQHSTWRNTFGGG